MSFDKTKLTKVQQYAGLPDKLWQMLTLALEDLTAIERAKSRYVVQMDNWHVPGFVEGKLGVRKEWDTDPDYMDRPKASCAVCFAGSVMACTLDIDPDKSMMPEDFPPIIEQKLAAVDAARSGDVREALWTFYAGDLDHHRSNSACYGVDIRKMKDYISVPEYEHGPGAFKNGIRAMIKELKAFNL